MSTAVTPDAPAAFESATDHSSFLPAGKDYQKTGVPTPKAEPQEIETPVTAPSPDADSAPAETQEQQEPEVEQEGAPEAARKAPQKTKETSESRWAKLSRENRELRDQIQRLNEPRDVKPEPQPAVEPQGTRPEPRIEDKKADGSNKYANWQEWFNDLRKWDREQAIAEARRDLQTQTKATAEQQQDQVINQEINRRVEQARKDYPDYDEVVAAGLQAKTAAGRDMIYIPKGSAVDLFLLESPRGQDVLYTILKDPEAYAPIFAHDEKGTFQMHPVRQLRELNKIEFSLGGTSKAPPVRKPSQAPAPVTQTSGKGTVARSSVQDAVEKSDQESYRTAANDNDPRLKAWRASRGK